MVYKLIIGRGMFWAHNIYNIECPNKYGGIGDCTIEGELWTGDTWVSADNFQISFGAIQAVESRSNTDESDEEWIVLWKQPETFTYEAWIDLAKMLRSKQCA